VLRELVKTTKDSIKEEEIKLKTIEDANQRIEKSIKDLVLRQRVWATKKSDDIIAYHHALGELEIVNIDQELSAHDARVTWKQHNQKFKSLERDYSAVQRSHDEDDKRLGKYQRELSSLQRHECYACGQQVHDANHETLVESKTSSIQKLTDTISKHRADMDALNVQLEGIGDLILEPTTYYDDVSDAYEHKNSIQQLQSVIDTKTQETDPYQDQIVILKETGICEISWDKMNDLNKLRDHQEFLFKLLTNKDSFIRKKIIEQNLTYLNARLSHYLETLGLPHQVSFQSDLSVQITELGRDMDFDNLSRGERNRLILGLSWGFRDVFESMNHPINFMAIDELVDSGMDGNGVEAALEVLKEMARERNKTIFLISHREDLLGRVSNTLKVVKENGFTSFQLEENG
jgi:DNA repair exonuclease SbcCD ATPase subunit